MEPVEAIRYLWSRKLLVGVVLAIAAIVAVLSAYSLSLSPPGLHNRSLQIGAASSQILIDSRKSALANGGDVNTFEALSTRAKIYGEYLSSLAARQEIAKLAGVSPRSITSSGPFSPATGQTNYEAQSSEDRANEILQEGAANRLVFTGQEGVPILTVTAQAATAATAVNLANASFTTLRRYVNSLEVEGEPIKRGVVVRELGAPEGGVIGGGNDLILIVMTFLVVTGLGCVVILVGPRFTQRWRALNQYEHDHPAPGQHLHTPPGFDNPYSVPAAEQQDSSSHGYDPTPLANAEHQEPVAPRAAHLH